MCHQKVYIEDKENANVSNNSGFVAPNEGPVEAAEEAADAENELNEDNDSSESDEDDDDDDDCVEQHLNETLNANSNSLGD